jgi:peptide deformylase
MTVREILKMGDPRLLRIAQPVAAFDTPELHALVADLFDTMEAEQGAGSQRRRSASTCRW